MEYQALSVSMVLFSDKKKTLLMKEENPCCVCFENWKDSFCCIGRNKINLNVLNFDLDIYIKSHY